MTNLVYKRMRQFVKNIYFLVKGYNWKKIQPIFIISTGRTGTQFFAELFSKGFKRVYAVHEPPPDLLELSLSFISNKISFKGGLGELRRLRMSLCKQVLLGKNSHYVESNTNIAFMIPLLKAFFPNYKMIHVIRDGRDYVRSAFSKVIFPTQNNQPTMLFMSPEDHRDRLQAPDLPSDPYNKCWDDLSRFQRICWYWITVNTIIEQAVEGDSRVLRVKYEDIFSEESGIEGVLKIIDFMGVADQMIFTQQDLKDFFRKKINYTEKYLLPSWDGWTTEQKRFFIEIASEKMKNYGYSIDG